MSLFSLGFGLKYTKVMRHLSEPFFFYNGAPEVQVYGWDHPSRFCVALSKVEVIPEKQEMDHISQTLLFLGGNVTHSCVSINVAIKAEVGG